MNKSFKFLSDTPNLFVKSLAEFLGVEISYPNDRSAFVEDKSIFVSWAGWGRNSSRDIFNKRKKAGLSSFILERGAFPDTLIADGTGFNYESELYKFKEWEKLMEWPELDLWEENIGHFMASKSSLEFQGEEPLPRTLGLNVFVPLQLKTDFVIKHYAGWAESVAGFFHKIKQAAAASPDVNFWVKRHPLGRAQFESKLPNIIFVDNCHYKDCIKNCDAVVTINSGVGAQSACYGKPTIVCGDAFYEDVPSVIKAQSVESILFAIQTHSPEERRRRYGAAFYLHLNRLYSHAILTKSDAVKRLNATSGCQFKSLSLNYGGQNRMTIN